MRSVNTAVRLGIVALLSAFFLALVLTGCGEPPKTGDSTKTEMEQTETNQVRLARKRPPPQLNDSTERANLIERLTRFNDPDKVSYIYLFNQGKLLSSDTVKGRPSSLNSLLTTPEQVVFVRNAGMDHPFVLPSPDFDGSYGKNPDGIFYFTPDGTYVETNATYVFRDRPFTMTQPPEYVVDETHRPAQAAPAAATSAPASKPATSGHPRHINAP